MLLYRETFLPLLHNCCVVIVTQIEEIPSDHQDYHPQENWEQLISYLLSSGIPDLLVKASSTCETQAPPASSTNTQNMPSSMYKLELLKHCGRMSYKHDLENQRVLGTKQSLHSESDFKLLHIKQDNSSFCSPVSAGVEWGIKIMPTFKRSSGKLREQCRGLGRWVGY